MDQMAEESVVSKLHQILRPFMIRRLKMDVEKSLPPKKEIKLYTGMSEMQEYWYKSCLNKDMLALNQLGRAYEYKVDEYAHAIEEGTFGIVLIQLHILHNTKYHFIF